MGVCLITPSIFVLVVWRQKFGLETVTGRDFFGYLKVFCLLVLVSCLLNMQLISRDEEEWNIGLKSRSFGVSHPALPLIRCVTSKSQCLHLWNGVNNSICLLVFVRLQWGDLWKAFTTGFRHNKPSIKIRNCSLFNFDFLYITAFVTFWLPAPYKVDFILWRYFFLS